MDVDVILKDAVENLNSQLFGLDSIAQVKKQLLAFQKNVKKLDSFDKELLIKLQKYQDDDERFVTFIKRWSKESRLFEIRDDTVKEKVRKPYSYKTHKTSYKDVGSYFQCDLAYMNDFNYNKMIYRKEYCIVLVDGVSGMVYLHATRLKNGKEILEGLKKIFERVKRQETIYLQTDNGTEFFNHHFYEWCESENIIHFSSNNLKKAYLAENAVRRLKKIYQKMRIIGKLDSVAWETKLLEVELAMNRKRRPASGITAEQLNRNDETGEALRMLDDFKIQKRKKNNFVYNNSTRIEKEKLNKKLQILKPLEVGKFVYLPKYRTDKRLLFAKPTTNMISEWDTDHVFEIIKVIENKHVANSLYSPPIMYKVIGQDEPFDTFILKREELYTLDREPKNIHYKNVKEYETEFYKKLKL